METEQLFTQRPLGQGRNNEIKVFLEINNNEGTKIYVSLWDTVKSSKRKVHSTTCLYKEIREIAY